jgi:hypothetical protein
MWRRRHQRRELVLTGGARFEYAPRLDWAKSESTAHSPLVAARRGETEVQDIRN